MDEDNIPLLSFALKIPISAILVLASVLFMRG